MHVMESLILLLLSLTGMHIDAAQLQKQQPVRHSRTEVRAARQTAIKPIVTVPITITPVNTTPPKQAPVPATQPTQTPDDFQTQVEQYVLAQTNAARAQNDLAALTSDSLVASVARAHSADMLAKNYFAHTNVSGCSAACRLTNAGYPWRSYGENIHWMSGYELSAKETAQKIVSDWMNSPGHRANILGAFTYAGVGIAVDGSKIYSTTVYTTK